MRFLMGLNEGFNGVKDQILLMNPLPDLDNAFNMVILAEKQRKVNQNFADPMEAVYF